MGLQKSDWITIAITIAIAGLICGTMAINYYGSKLPELTQSNNDILEQHSNYANFKAEGQSKLEALSNKIIESFPKGIACWGDDFTYGTSGNKVTYPNTLKDTLLKNLYTDDLYSLCPDIQNYGATGENVLTLFGKSGAIPYILSSNLDIPKDMSPTPIKFISSWLNGVNPLVNGDNGMEYVTINGIRGTIKLENNQYYFTRSEYGEATTIPSGTEIITSAEQNSIGYMPIIFIGRNSGYTDNFDLVYKQQKLIEYYGNDKYLVVGLVTGTTESNQELDSLMLSKFGNNFVNIREYLSTQAIYDTDISPTQDDLNAMAVGSVPPSLLSDSIHLNSIGYELVGKYLYSYMENLGYFDDIKSYIEEYNKIKIEYDL